jgi:hypothetical protein
MFDANRDAAADGHDVPRLRDRRRDRTAGVGLTSSPSRLNASCARAGIVRELAMVTPPAKPD